MQVNSAGHHAGKWPLDMRIMNRSHREDLKILPFPCCWNEGSHKLRELDSHMDIWHPGLFIRHQSSNTHMDKSIQVGEGCCGPKFQLTMTLCHVLLPWRAPCWYHLQKDKEINLGRSTSLLKGFHLSQILICLDILPQLVHRREDTYMLISFAINSNQCDTFKIKYAIFPKPYQKSLDVCGKNSSGFTKAESGSIIHESCFHDIEKKRPLFSILHCLNLDLYFICPWSFKALIPAKICGYKNSTVASLLSLPWGTDTNIHIFSRDIHNFEVCLML